MPYPEAGNEPTGVPHSGNYTCPRCGCPPHVDMSKGVDKECPRCGCPPFMESKKENDELGMTAHRDAGRLGSGGFY